MYAGVFPQKHLRIGIFPCKMVFFKYFSMENFVDINESRAYLNYLLTLGLRQEEAFGPMALDFIRETDFDAVGFLPEEQFSLVMATIQALAQEPKRYTLKLEMLNRALELVNKTTYSNPQLTRQIEQDIKKTTTEINIYNEATLRYFEKGGAKRVSLNHELPCSSLKALADAATAELEVQVFGRLPLAISARCYHARAHNLNKGGCQYVCDRDADGLTVDTLDGVPFLVINGLQTMSYTYCNLMKELPEMLGMGINNFRLSPHDVDMVKVTQLYRDCLDGKIESDEASQSLEDEVFAAEFSNGFYHGEPGMEQVEL